MANYVSTHTGNQIDQAVDMAHEHSNKAILDGISESGYVGEVLTKTESGAIWAPSGGSGGQGLKAQGGRTETSYNIAAGKYIDVQIGFPTEYLTPPAGVMVCMESASTSGKLALVECAVLRDSITKYGFTVRVYNGDSIAHGSQYIRWIAFGV